MNTDINFWLSQAILHVKEVAFLLNDKGHMNWEYASLLDMLESELKFVSDELNPIEK